MQTLVASALGPRAWYGHLLYYGHRGYYMAERRYEISLRVLKNISRVSAANEWNIFQHSKKYERRDLLCSHSKGDIFTCEDNMLFSHVKISSFCAKAHLVFHWCLYNKVWFVPRENISFIFYDPLCVRIKGVCLWFIYVQILMSASLQMLVESILSVITPLDHTDVNVWLDLLQTAVSRNQLM